MSDNHEINAASSHQSPATGGDDEPLQLIQFVCNEEGENTSIQLNEENLLTVFGKAKNQPLCILCICGPSRQGKSFMLGHMIRCLEALEIDDADWMERYSSTEALTGFKFQNGDTPQTQGIWIWSRPFFVKNDKDEEVAVFLMDTQGTNDEYTTIKDMSAIVGLSLLTSSVMIFNFFTNLQEDTLGALNVYMEYGKLALDNNIQGSPFQKLVFLIRDWNNPDQYPYGKIGGGKFLDEKLKIKNGQPAEAKQVREAVNHCFEEMQCFLMPNIGEEALSRNFKGSLAELTPKFKDNMEKFINGVTSPEALVIKKILNNVVTAEELISYLKICVKTLNSSDMLSANNMWEVTVVVRNESLIRKAKQVFIVSMDKQRQRKVYLSLDQMEKSQTKAEEDAFKLFDSENKLGSLEKIAEFRTQLTEQISQEKAEVVRQNELRRDKYIIRVTKDAIVNYANLLKKVTPFDENDENKFYEEAVIQNADKKARSEVLEDFRDKLECESEQDLDVLVKTLETTIEFSLSSIMNQNKVHRAEAERSMAELVRQTVVQVEEELRAFCRDNELAGCDHLQKSYENEKAKALQTFKNVKKPGSREFQREYQEGLEKQLEEIYSKLENEHKLYLQNVRQTTENCIQKISHEYAEFLKEYKQGITVAALRKIHEQRGTQLLENFVCHENPYPEGHSERDHFVERLDALLGETLDKVTRELTDWIRHCEESHKAAMEKSFLTYFTNMKSLLDVTEFVDEEELVNQHVMTLDETLKHYAAAEKLGDPEQTDNFGKMLENKISSHFSEVKTNNENNHENAETLAQKYVLEGQKLYEEQLYEDFDDIQKTSILKARHHKAQQAAVAWLWNKCPGKRYPDFVEGYMVKLREGISRMFKDTEQIFEMKRKQEEVAFKAVQLECRDAYNAEMTKHCQNTKFINKNHLYELHRQACTAVLVRFMKRPESLSDTLKRDLQAEMDKLYIKYDRENSMKLNSAGGAPAIGIDLGTTHCCVAVYINKEVIYIPNRKEANNETTPSYVAFDDRGNLVFGNTAKEGAHENPENTIYDAKRIIGKTMGDRELQSDMKFWPFKVIGEKGVPMIKVRGKHYFPEQISAKLLEELRAMTEQHLGLSLNSIEKAAITVPAYFNEGQRRATKVAGDIAGLKFVTILNEPTAAALAYSLGPFDTNNKQALIFDLGGGTFDVAVLKVSPGNVDIVTVAGDTHLGGEDFDKEMMHYCVNSFKATDRIDLLKGKSSVNENERHEVRRRLRRLQTKCEEAKKILSSALTAVVQVDGICQGRDLKVKVTRGKFEELNRHHIQKAIDILDKCLSDKQLRKEDIDDVVLVGGSTRIPLVKKMLKDYFGGSKALNESIDPDKAVAYGAAVKAAMMNGDQAMGCLVFTQDVTPYSIGVEVRDKSLSVVIPKDTKIPIKKNRVHCTADDNQESAYFAVYQGEKRIAAHNELLGSFVLENIPPAPKHQEALDVIMEIDSNGLLHVEAVCESTQGRKKITIKDNRKGMDAETKRRLIEERNN